MILLLHSFYLTLGIEFLLLPLPIIYKERLYMQPSKQEDPIHSIKSRFFRLFLAMYTTRGWLYTQGYFLGWLAYLARYDLIVQNRLSYLEEKYGLAEKED